MQDLSTGGMVPLRDPDEIYKELKAEGRLATRLEALQAACDEALPDRRLHGPVFQVGEILILRGGRFEVEQITQEGLVLKGLPTRSAV